MPRPTTSRRSTSSCWRDCVAASHTAPVFTVKGGRLWPPGPRHRERCDSVTPVHRSRLTKHRRVARQHPRREVFDDDVGLRREPQIELPAFLGSEIQRDPELASIPSVERARVVSIGLAQPDGRPPGHRDTGHAVRRANLDHLGTEVRQHLSQQRPGPDVSVVEHAQACSSALESALCDAL